MTLLEAITTRDTKIIEECIKSIKNIDEPLVCSTSYGIRNWTALIYASRYNMVQSVKLCIKYGANVNSKTDNGDTALLLAVWNDHSETVKLLLDSGADINVKNNSGDTALSLATFVFSNNIYNYLKFHQRIRS